MHLYIMYFTPQFLFSYAPFLRGSERRARGIRSWNQTHWMTDPCADVPGHLHIVQVWMREVQKSAGCTKLGLVVFQVNLNILAINLSVKISRFFLIALPGCVINFFPIRQPVPVGLARARICCWARWAWIYNTYSWILPLSVAQGRREWGMVMVWFGCHSHLGNIWVI